MLPNSDLQEHEWNPFRISLCFHSQHFLLLLTGPVSVRSTQSALPNCNEHALIQNEPSWDMNLLSLTASQRSAFRTVEMIFLLACFLMITPFQLSPQNKLPEILYGTVLTFICEDDYRQWLGMNDWKKKCRAGKKEKRVSTLKVTLASWRALGESVFMRPVH